MCRACPNTQTLHAVMGCPHIQSQCWLRDKSPNSQTQTSNNNQRKPNAYVGPLNPKVGSVCKWKRQVTVNSRGHWIDMRSWNMPGYYGELSILCCYTAKAKDKSTSWHHWVLTCTCIHKWDKKINKSLKKTYTETNTFTGKVKRRAAETKWRDSTT